MKQNKENTYACSFDMKLIQEILPWVYLTEDDSLTCYYLSTSDSLAFLLKAKHSTS